jgi:hypothetical protein
VKKKYDAGFSRLHAPLFTGVVRNEVKLLRQLSPWIRWLYLELRMLSDFKTGELVTSWAQLEAVMGCDDYQALSPSRQAIRRGIESLVEVDLAEHLVTLSTVTKQVFLKINPVTRFSASREVADRPADRPADRSRIQQNTSNGAASSEINGVLPTDLPTEQATGDSIPINQSPYPLSAGQLSTGRAEVEGAPNGRGRQRAIAMRNLIAKRRGGPQK